MVGDDDNNDNEDGNEAAVGTTGDSTMVARCTVTRKGRRLKEDKASMPLVTLLATTTAVIQEKRRASPMTKGARHPLWMQRQGSAQDQCGGGGRELRKMGESDEEVIIAVVKLSSFTYKCCFGSEYDWPILIIVREIIAVTREALMLVL